MLKTVKKWMWDSGRPPLFFSKFPHFPGFFLEDVPNVDKIITLAPIPEPSSGKSSALAEKNTPEDTSDPCKTQSKKILSHFIGPLQSFCYDTV